MSRPHRAPYDCVTRPECVTRPCSAWPDPAVRGQTLQCVASIPGLWDADPNVAGQPSSHKTLNQCWFNVKPTLNKRVVSAGSEDLWPAVLASASIHVDGLLASTSTTLHSRRLADCLLLPASQSCSHVITKAEK